jgi:hypothetical protein
MIMRMGRVQRRVWDRACASRLGLVKPSGWRERRACKRLADRALLKPALGYPDTWRNA